MTKNEADTLVYAAVLAITRELGSEDWLNRINLETFDLSSSETCVLGQVYGDYWHFKAAPLRQGPSSSAFIPQGRGRNSFVRVKNAWKRLLKARKSDVYTTPA